MIWSNVLSFNWPSSWVLSKSIYRLKDAKAKHKRMGLVIKNGNSWIIRCLWKWQVFFWGFSTNTSNLGRLNSLQCVCLHSSWSVPVRQISFVDCPSWSCHWLEGSVTAAPWIALFVKGFTMCVLEVTYRSWSPTSLIVLRVKNIWNYKY